MKSADPWSPLIWQDNFPNFDWNQLKPKCDSLLNQVKKNSYIEKDGGISSVSLQTSADTQPHTWAEFAELQQWLNPKINEVIKNLKLMEQPYQVSNSWINKHPPGAWTDEHCHKGCQITMAIYLHVPANSGRIMFKDPLEYHWWGDPSDHRSAQNGNWYPVDIQTGDVLMFPGWLQHKTEVNNSQEDRYVLTVNLMGTIPLRNLVEMGVIG